MKKVWMYAFAALSLSVNAYANNADEATGNTEVVNHEEKKAECENECSSDVATSETNDTSAS